MAEPEEHAPAPDPPPLPPPAPPPVPPPPPGSPPGAKVQGVVNWFNVAKGFGAYPTHTDVNAKKQRLRGCCKL